MKNHIPLLAVLALFATTLTLRAADTQPATQPAQPIVGGKAPDFTLNTLEGKPVTLSTVLKDGPVVLVQLRGWVGYQCPICQKQTATLAAHAKDITATGASVILVYPGPADHLKEHAAEFVAGKDLPEKFYFVIDPDLNFVNAYGLRWNKKGETAYPSTFVVNKDGDVTFKKVSKSHGDRASLKDILAALK